MAIIDWALFNENFQYYDSGVINEVIGIFIDEYDQRIAALEKNIDEKDFINLAFNAHSLKSVISNYMAPRALDLTSRLEEMARSKMDEGLYENFTELKIVTQELLSELRNYLQRISN